MLAVLKPMLALLLTLISSLGWAAFDALRKLMVHRSEPLVLVVWLNLVQVPCFVAWWWLEPGHAFNDAYFSYYSASLFCNTAANLCFLRALELSPLSTMIPLLSITPAFTAILGLVWLGEGVDNRQWLGICCVVIGACLLHSTAGDLRRPWRLVTALVRERGSLAMTSVALLWSVAPFFDKRALEHASVGLHATLLCAGVALSAALMWAIKGRRRPSSVSVAHQTRGSAHTGRPLALALAASALAALVAFGCQLLAIQLMFVSLFEGIKRGVGMSLSVVSGRLLFGEPVTVVKVSSVAIMTLGVLCLV